MRYLALATDYDGTPASHGEVSQETVRALDRVRISGRRVVLVTGRRLDDLFAVCACTRLFDLVVAENGAIVYGPAERRNDTSGQSSVITANTGPAGTRC